MKSCRPMQAVLLLKLMDCVLNRGTGVTKGNSGSENEIVVKMVLLKCACSGVASTDDDISEDIVWRRWFVFCLLLREFPLKFYLQPLQFKGSSFFLFIHRSNHPLEEYLEREEKNRIEPTILCSRQIWRRL